MTIHVTVWGENVHEHKSELVRSHYPNGMHECIADALNQDVEIRARTATLQQPEHGLTDEVLENTDVLTWWGTPPTTRWPTRSSTKCSGVCSKGWGSSSFTAVTTRRSSSA